MKKLPFWYPACAAFGPLLIVIGFGSVPIYWVSCLGAALTGIALVWVGWRASLR